MNPHCSGCHCHDCILAGREGDLARGADHLSPAILGSTTFAIPEYPRLDANSFLNGISQDDMREMLDNASQPHQIDAWVKEAVKTSTAAQDSSNVPDLYEPNNLASKDLLDQLKHTISEVQSTFHVVSKSGHSSKSKKQSPQYRVCEPLDASSLFPPRPSIPYVTRQYVSNPIGTGLPQPTHEYTYEVVPGSNIRFASKGKRRASPPNISPEARQTWDSALIRAHQTAQDVCLTFGVSRDNYLSLLNKANVTSVTRDFRQASRGVKVRTRKLKGGNSSSAKNESRPCIYCKFHKIRCIRPNPGVMCQHCLTEYGHNFYIIEFWPNQALSLGDVFFDHFVTLQHCLLAIRDEQGSIPGMEGSLRYDSHSPMLCRFEDGEDLHNELSELSQPVVVNRRLTTINKNELLPGNVVPPALNKTQMKQFGDRWICKSLGQRFQSVNTGIVTTSLRCARWLAILFNMDNNKIFQSREVSFDESRDLVLETTFSILHEIQYQFAVLYNEVVNYRPNNVDPVTVSCALSLLYLSISSHEKLLRTHGVSGSLRTLLENFARSVDPALKALQSVKKAQGVYCCTTAGKNMQVHKDLIELQSKITPVLHITYEKTNYNQEFGFLSDHLLTGRSYTEALTTRPWNRDFEQDSGDIGCIPQQNEAYYPGSIDGDFFSSSLLPAGTGAVSNPIYPLSPEHLARNSDPWEDIACDSLNLDPLLDIGNDMTLFEPTSVQEQPCSEQCFVYNDVEARRNYAFQGDGGWAWNEEAVDMAGLFPGEIDWS